jgi:hypothetical protein
VGAEVPKRGDDPCHRACLGKGAGIRLRFALGELLSARCSPPQQRRRRQREGGVGAEVWERQGCVRREGAPTSACASPLPSNYNQCATTGLGMGPERAADEMGRAGTGERRPSAGKRLRGGRREAAAPSPLLVLAGGGGPSCTHWRSCSPSRMGATEGEEEAHPRARACRQGWAPPKEKWKPIPAPDAALSLLLVGAPQMSPPLRASNLCSPCCLVPRTRLTDSHRQ